MFDSSQHSHGKGRYASTLISRETSIRDTRVGCRAKKSAGRNSIVSAPILRSRQRVARPLMSTTNVAKRKRETSLASELRSPAHAAANSRRSAASGSCSARRLTSSASSVSDRISSVLALPSTRSSLQRRRPVKTTPQSACVSRRYRANWRFVASPATQSTFVSTIRSGADTGRKWSLVGQRRSMSWRYRSAPKSNGTVFSNSTKKCSNPWRIRSSGPSLKSRCRTGQRRSVWYPRWTSTTRALQAGNSSLIDTGNCVTLPTGSGQVVR